MRSRRQHSSRVAHQSHRYIRALVAVTVCCGLAPSCLISVDYTGTEYRCSDSPECPDGFGCVEGVCRDQALPSPDAAISLDSAATDATSGSRRYRRSLTITAGSAPVPADYSVAAELDLASLVEQGKARADGGDVRILCSDIEVPHYLDRVTAEESGIIRLWFMVPAAVAADESDTSCELRHGDLDLLPPTALWSDSMGADGASPVFLHGDDFAEHSVGAVADGWTEQGSEVHQVAAHGERMWLQPETRVDWRDGTTATAMEELEDAVWAADILYWQEGDDGWGGVGARVGAGGAGKIVAVYDGAWNVGDQDWADSTGWQANSDVHLPLGTHGRLEVITHGTALRAYWYNPDGYTPRRVLLTDMLVTAATGTLAVLLERPMVGNQRWLAAGNVTVRRYIDPQPAVVLGAEQELE